MKRSKINTYLSQSMGFFKEMNFHLPYWAFWKPEDWKGKKAEVEEIIQCGLGWDITDFGSEDFENTGLINFNLRNGIPGRGRKTYCEKIIIVEENQITPWHTHRLKVEDIINRGGGNLVIELQNSTDFNLNDMPVTVSVDGIKKTVTSKGSVVLKPGESIFLEPGVFHLFYGEPGKGKVLVGEVSTVNDDNTDNVFTEERPRFPSIEEDEEPLHLLVNDYIRFVS